MNQNLIIIFLLLLLIFCCLFQQKYNMFYKHAFTKEGYENLNKTSLGNMNLPIKYILLDMSRNKKQNTLKNFSIFVLSNGNIEKVDLSNISTVNYVYNNLETIKETNEYEIKVGSSKDYNIKTLNLPYKNMIVDERPINNSSNNKYEVNINDTTLTVKRTDSSKGWDDELELMGYYKDDSKHHSLNSNVKNIIDNTNDNITIEGNHKKILFTLNNNYIKLPTIDKIVILSDDETLEDTLLEIKFLDENKNLVSNLNIEVFQNSNNVVNYKKFVYYNSIFYKDKLPIDYLFNNEYNSNNTFFKSFLYKLNDDNSNNDVKCSNCDSNYTELNTYYNSNDYKKGPTSLSSYYSRMNQEENITHPSLEISSQLNNTQLESNDDNNLSNIMNTLSSNNTLMSNINYKKQYSKLNNNTMLNTYQLNTNNKRNDVYSDINGKNIYRGQYYIIDNKEQ